MIISILIFILCVAIIWLVTPWIRILARMWFILGGYLFQYTVMHDDSVSGKVYGLTFTNDDLWQDKMLRDLQKPAVMLNDVEDE